MSLHRLVLASAVLATVHVACSSSEDPPPDAGVVEDGGAPPPDGGENPPPPDGGVNPPPDGGTPDLGTPDTGEPDTGVPDTGVPDTGLPDTGPAPVLSVNVSGQLRKLGEYLAGNTVGVGQANLLAYGVSPLGVTMTQDGATAGNYGLDVPPNGQLILYSSKLGYFPSYNTVTVENVDATNKNLYIAENAWLNEIAGAHNVNLATPFACHAPALDPAQQCIYAAIVGRVLDDGAAGNGTRRPVADITQAEFTVYGGPAANDQWYKKGPYFLNYTGTSSVGALGTIVYNDGAGNYRGGLFVTFVEIPQTDGPESISVRISIRHDVGGGAYRYFGPIDLKAFRPYGVTWTTIVETGVAPPPPNNNIDFDTQIYPLFLPVNQGGLGCQGCHTNQGGAVPSGGMNLYGGPDMAFASLNPASYPNRVNVQNPSASYLLTKPLYEATGLQDHPIFAFVSEQDLAYQLIYTWISEGAVRNVVQPPVSFANEIRPLLYNQVAQGGMGCRNCHYDGVDANTAPGGFYMGGGAPGLYLELTGEAPTDNGATGEAYRINKQQGYTERSLVLTNPLFGNAEPHPVKVFSSNADPRYQLVYRWIAEGYQDN